MIVFVLFLYSFVANGKRCSEAIENITKHYPKLTVGFPTDCLVPQLYAKKVINDEQKEEIQKKTMKKDKVSILFDDVIKPELVVGVSTKYDNLIEVMKSSDDSTAKHLANLLEGKSCSFYACVCEYMHNCMYKYVSKYIYICSMYYYVCMYIRSSSRLIVSNVSCPSIITIHVDLGYIMLRLTQ